MFVVEGFKVIIFSYIWKVQVNGLKFYFGDQVSSERGKLLGIFIEIRNWLFRKFFESNKKNVN